MDQNPDAAPVPAAPEPAAFTPVPGGFWLRGGALMIDYLVVGIAAGIALFMAPPIVALPARLALSIAYFTVVPVRWNGQTLGKTAAGIALYREDGEPLGYGTTFVRWLGYFVCIVTLGIGFVVAAFTENKRGLHDYIAGTRVMQIERPFPREVGQLKVESEVVKHPTEDSENGEAEDGRADHRGAEGIGIWN